MTKIKSMLIASAGFAILGGCQTTGSYSDKSSASAIGADAIAANVGESWPSAHCPDAAALRAWIAERSNQTKMAYFGLYADGHSFWLGTNHGKNIFRPADAYAIPPGKQPFVMRWNIADAPPGGSNIWSDYVFDHDPARDGEFGVRAFAVNQCETDNDGNYGSCDQPEFGQTAWEEDSEFCPPIILPEDTSSIYLWDNNDLKDLPQVYEYSIALILKSKGPNDKKAGMRIIVDPKVKNGGGRGNR